MTALPPREVPEGLSQLEYYELGLKYKAMGWTEQARDALTLAQEGEAASEVSVSAKRFLLTRIPRFPVPLFAEQKNIQGFNQMVVGDVEAAKQTFEELIRDFPDFEWPYGNLSFLYMQEGDTARAEKLLDQALSINPHYVNGWLHLARAKGLEMDFEGAHECVKRALDSDPGDPAARALKEALDQFKQQGFEAKEKPGSKPEDAGTDELGGMEI